MHLTCGSWLASDELTPDLKPEPTHLPRQIIGQAA